MKVRIICTCFTGLIMVYNLSAQVGINTVKPKSTLDIQIKNGSSSGDPEGIIAPRLKLSELKDRDNAYQNDQIGAIVYVTETSGDTTLKTSKITSPGYYYFNGTQWIPMASTGSGSGQEIWYEVNTSNPSSTNKTNSYLNAKVVIGDKPKVNSFNPSTELIPADVNGEKAQLTVIGEDAVINGITVGTGKTQGSMPWATNTAIGLSALSQNEADDNTAIGKWALAANKTGANNIALGSNANNIPDAEFNNTIAIGVNANAIKDGATAIGYSSRSTENSAISIGNNSNATGIKSVALGDESYSTGTSSTALGNKSAASGDYSLATGFNSAAIGNNSVSIGINSRNELPNSTFIKNAGVIIGNNMPTKINTTLQVIGNPSDPNAADGFMVPMVTRSQLQLKENSNNNVYGENQEGALVYVTDVDGYTPSANSQTAQITDAGHYYYNSNIFSNGSGQWVKISQGMRHEYAYVNASWTNDPKKGHYNNLQDAYTLEAQKMYNPINGGVVNFICLGEGNLGDLIANGEIPYIYITVDNNDPVTLGDLEFNNMRATFFVPANTTYTINTKKIKASGANITLTKQAKINAVGGIELSQSKLFTMGEDANDNYIRTDYIATSSSLAIFKNCKLDIVANENVKKPDACISCAQGSYIELGVNTEVNLNRETVLAGIWSKTNGAIQMNSCKINILNQYSADLSVTSCGSIVITDNTIIQGSTSSDSFLQVNTLGKASIESTNITRTGIKNSGIESINGGEVIINAYGTVAQISPSTTSNIGFYANGGAITVVGGLNNNKPIDISQFSSSNCLMAVGGGVIKTNNQVRHSSVGLNTGKFSLSGSAIFDSNINL